MTSARDPLPTIPHPNAAVKPHCRAIAPQQRKPAGRVINPTTTAAVKQHHREGGFNDPPTDDIKMQ
jgi:hypothetical protein